MTEPGPAAVTSRRVASRVVWFNCQAGVAGDMTMASLVDAGADPDVIAQTIAGLGVDGYALLFERVQRCGVRSTWANVVIDHHDGDHDGHDTTITTRDGPRQRAACPPPPGARSSPCSTAPSSPIACAGAPAGCSNDWPRWRGRSTASPRDVELHEVGALDSIIDVVGVCAALESLDVDEVRCSPIAVGHGSVRSAHGVIPNPAPATTALLAEASVPTVGLDTTMEVSTPTGVALMTTLATAFGPMPSMVATAVGYGAGTADTPGRANVVQAVVGTSDAAIASADGSTGRRLDGGTPVALLEANVDDVTGEVLAHSVAQLLAAGAHDAWITPIVMKKGRPAHTVSALCDPTAVGTMRDVLVRETGTLGVRRSTLVRWPQRRSEITVDVSGHAVRVKLAEHRIKPEFDDAAVAAAALGIPVRHVLDRAAELARETHARADRPHT
jgi:pyridinium-3,5-bisthiocarboxylic acid mononucleotide nickel chelatase